MPISNIAPGSVLGSQLRYLRHRLAAALGQARSTDDVTRAALAASLELPGSIRAGLALSRTGGRQLQFASSDADSFGRQTVRWSLIDGFDDIPLVDVVRTFDDVYIDNTRQLDSAYPDIAERERSLGTRSIATLALATDQRGLGGLMICFDHEQVFAHECRWILSTLAAQVTQALCRLRVQRAEDATFEQFQRSLTTRQLPDLPGLAFGSYSQAGGINRETGGGYDVVPLPDGSTAVVIGDVMEHGAAATAAVNEFRSALRAYAVLDPTPSVVLSRLDTLVASGTLSEQLVTALYGVISADHQTLTIASAGHLPALLVTPEDVTVVPDENIGPALGLGAGVWTDTTVRLDPITTLFLYSTGLVGACDLDLSNWTGQLAAHLSDLPRRRRNPRELCTHVRNLIGRNEDADGVTMLAVGLTPVGSTRTASVTLPADTTAPGLARRFIRDTLDAWSLGGDLAERSVLCVSELVTNAVIHAGTAAAIIATLDAERLTVIVRDHGIEGSVEEIDEQDPERVSGRGLTLVGALASTWGSEQDGDGTTAWFEMERTQPPSD